MPAPHYFKEDPFAPDASESVYAYNYFPTISPTDFQITSPKSFVSMIDQFDSSQRIHQMTRSKSSKSRSRSSSTSRHSSSSSLSRLYDVPGPFTDHPTTRKRVPVPTPSQWTQREPLSNTNTTSNPRRSPSPPSPSKLRSSLTPTRPAPSPPPHPYALPQPPFMIPSSRIHTPVPRRPSTPTPTPPAPKRLSSPNRRSPDLYKHVLQTNFTSSPAGQKTLEMGTRMALRLWNANKELERLIKFHEEVLVGFGSGSGEKTATQMDWRKTRSTTPTPLAPSPSHSRSPSSEWDYFNFSLSYADEPSSITEYILADMDSNTSPTSSPETSPTTPTSFFEDDFESLDPFMQLPHPIAQSPSVMCF